MPLQGAFTPGKVIQFLHSQTNELRYGKVRLASFISQLEYSEFLKKVRLFGVRVTVIKFLK